MFFKANPTEHRLSSQAESERGKPVGTSTQMLHLYAQRIDEALHEAEAQALDVFSDVTFSDADRLREKALQIALIRHGRAVSRFGPI